MNLRQTSAKWRKSLEGVVAGLLRNLRHHLRHWRTSPKTTSANIYIYICGGGWRRSCLMVLYLVKNLRQGYVKTSAMAEVVFGRPIVCDIIPPFTSAGIQPR